MVLLIVALSETTQAVPRGFQDAGRLVVRLVRRSRKTLSHDHDNLLLIKDLSAAMSRCRNDVDAIATWDIAKDSSVRRGMKALFEEKLDTGVLEDYQLKRTSWSEPVGANQLERTHLEGMHTNARWTVLHQVVDKMLHKAPHTKAPDGAILYVYFFIHGRFLQLRVDLGYRIPLDNCLGDDEDWKQDRRTRWRALRVWDKNLAAIGTMNHSQYDNLNWATVRGRNDGVLNRFVALHGIHKVDFYYEY
ncbi:hypothetical protein BKA90DRAFT_160904 [Yarrowia lipolytica]|nr:hypothetical protein BKA90DRAFT_160904 [Yarrowia lipolytica]